MPVFDTACPSCQKVQEDVTLPSGFHPICECGAETIYLWRGRSSGRFTDESFIGGLVIENLGHEPVTVYSRQELAVRMREAGVEQRIKYVPGDTQLTDWSKSIDQYTLDAARALVSRQGGTSRDPEVVAPLIPVTVTIREI